MCVCVSETEREGGERVCHKTVYSIYVTHLVVNRSSQKVANPDNQSTVGWASIVCTLLGNNIMNGRGILNLHAVEGMHTGT